jgi:hypothetical protein
MTPSAAKALSKPAMKLLAVVSSFVTGVAEPRQIKRLASAKAEAAKIKAKGAVDAAAIIQRAAIRVRSEEFRAQKNLEKIIMKALPDVAPTATPEAIEPDWMANFLHKCRLASDEQMQQLWSKILAGEANAPGAFSKRTVEAVTLLSKGEAEDFTKICSFYAGDELYIFNFDDPVYQNRGVTWSTVRSMQDAGLVTMASPGIVFALGGLPQNFTLRYFDVDIKLTLPEKSGNGLSFGVVSLTRSGKELARICKAEKCQTFLDYLVRQFSPGYGPHLS